MLDTVVPMNPDQVARRLGPAKKKNAAKDARIAYVIALDRFDYERRQPQPLSHQGCRMTTTTHMVDKRLLAATPRLRLCPFNLAETEMPRRHRAAISQTDH